MLSVNGAFGQLLQSFSLLSLDTFKYKIDMTITTKTQLTILHVYDNSSTMYGKCIKCEFIGRCTNALISACHLNSIQNKQHGGIGRNTNNNGQTI